MNSVDELLKLAQIGMDAGEWYAAEKYYKQALQELLGRNEALKQALKEKHPGLIEKIEALEAENQALKKEIQEKARAFKREKQELVDELGKITEALREAGREIEERPVREWHEWLRGLTKLSYEREIEVEVKFILPLVKYLGYRENDVQLHKNVYVQVGREKKRGQADWVLWDRSGQVVRAVIEAKGPTQHLDRGMKEQARSYALTLRAPVYAITNGKRFMVFRCGVQADVCIVDCDVGRLGEVWPKIHQEMGVGPSIHRIA